MENQVDYLKKYISDDKFDIPRLINDDFFLAIKLCFKHKYYVSATKLLLSFIDSISFVAYGESNGKYFQEWLKEYCDLNSLGITEFELWEHRNSILHMTGLESRQVKNKKCKTIVGYIGKVSNMPNLNTSECSYYDMYDLMKNIAKGIEKYIASIKPNELETFVERYDLIVSDTRMLIINSAS